MLIPDAGTARCVEHLPRPIQPLGQVGRLVAGHGYPDPRSESGTPADRLDDRPGPPAHRRGRENIDDGLINRSSRGRVTRAHVVGDDMGNLVRMIATSCPKAGMTESDA